MFRGLPPSIVKKEQELLEEICSTNRFFATRCRKCGETYFPPRPICPECMVEDYEKVEVSGLGKIVSFTVIYEASKEFKDLAPYALAIVELDEGARGMGMVLGADVSKLSVGARVRAKAWKRGDQYRVDFELVE